MNTGSRHVGEHGRAETSSHDQPVRPDGRMRCRPGEAAPPGGPLAVRGESEPPEPPHAPVNGSDGPVLPAVSISS